MRAQTIGLVAHTGKPGVAGLARDVTREFEKHSVRVLIETATAALASLQASGSVARLMQDADLLVVLGGDGTILNVVGQADDVLKPIFGINVGSLGFLTCVNSSAYREAVDAIVSGEIAYSERALLAIELRENERVVNRTHALNDAVISRGHVPDQIFKLIHLGDPFVGLVQVLHRCVDARGESLGVFCLSEWFLEIDIL